MKFKKTEAANKNIERMTFNWLLFGFLCVAVAVFRCRANGLGLVASRVFFHP